jgi:hypothetical protein
MTVKIHADSVQIYSDTRLVYAARSPGSLQSAGFHGEFFGGEKSAVRDLT